MKLLKNKLSNFFYHTAIRKLLKKFLIAVGIITLFCIAISIFIPRKSLSRLAIEKTQQKVIPASFPKEMINEEIYQSMISAYNKAEKYASNELDNWIDTVMMQADSEFLPWYFKFSNTKMRELKQLGYSLGHMLFDEIPSSEEIILKDLEKGLNCYLFQPEITQITFENILRNTIRIYNQALSEDLSKIQIKYNISTPEWNRYLEDLSHVVQDSGTSLMPTYEKSIIAATGAATILLGGISIHCTKAISEGIGKLLNKTTAKTVAKTGGKSLGRFIGPLITVAILIWDITEYKIATSKDKPVLRQNILNYLQNVKETLLYDEEFGICTELNNVQNKIAFKI